MKKIRRGDKERGEEIMREIKKGWIRIGTTGRRKRMKGNVMKRVEQWKKKRRQAEETRKGT